MMKKYRLMPYISAILVAFICLALFSVRDVPSTAPADSDTDVPVLKDQDERITLLIGGTDRASGLTDVLMLLTVDTSDHSACILQIPRDTYAAYTEKNYKKINGAYGALGGEGLSALFSECFDIKIDGYIVLSPNAFRRAVDAIGGVEVEIEKNMYYNDPAQDLYIYLQAGRQTLDGEKAEQFIRYRSGYANGDLGRMDTQKIFLVSAARKLKNEVSGIEMLKIATSLMSGTDTDITPAQVSPIIEALKEADERSIVLLTAPGESVTAKSGASYYSLSAPAMKEILEKYFDGGRKFDPQRLFLNKNNAEFGKIYEGYSSYTPMRADEID